MCTGICYRSIKKIRLGMVIKNFNKIPKIETTIKEIKARTTTPTNLEEFLSITNVKFKKANV
nr:hypothetical protein BACY1_19950 [Tenacibaculum mesophilum]